jgi:hypothetical protein
VILTIIAALLGLQAWMSMSSQPVFASESKAAGDPPTFPNAAQQREEMIKAIRELSTHMKRTNELLESSTISVEVANADAFKVKDAE